MLLLATIFGFVSGFVSVLMLLVPNQSYSIGGSTGSTRMQLEANV